MVKVKITKNDFSDTPVTLMDNKISVTFLTLVILGYSWLTSVIKFAIYLLQYLQGAIFK